MKNLITCFAVCVLSGATLADTWTVDDDGKADFDNIQAAVDAASNGDEIIVMAGNYSAFGKNGVVNMRGKQITLKSQEGPDVTFIDGNNILRCFYCNSGENENTIIEGFTIQNGYADSIGGGMRNFNSNPTVRNCIFKNNSAADKGGGMFNSGGSSPVIENCRFENNSDSQGGGGIYNREDNNNPQISNTTLCSNSPSNIYGTWTDLGGNEDLEFCPRTLTVNPNGKGDFLNIQDAIEEANEGDEIIVTPGTYTGDGYSTVNLLGKAITLRSTEGPEKTIISGEGLRRGIQCNSQEGLDTIIDGFSIMDCNFAGTGAGIALENASPNIINCTISGSQATANGGGIYAYQSEAVISNCTIQNNSCGDEGGGIYIIVSDMLFSNCTVQQNSCADSGAGIYIQESNVSIDKTIIQNNISSRGGGVTTILSTLDISNSSIEENSATGTRGGGIYCDSGSTLTVESCNISSNLSHNDGAGIYCDLNTNVFIANSHLNSNIAQLKGGGIYAYNGTLIMENTQLYQNLAESGGGIFAENTDFTISESHFDMNRAESSGIANGGGIRIDGATGEITNSDFNGNYAQDDGGGVYITSNNTSFTGCRFISNEAEYDGAGARVYNGSTAYFVECIFLLNKTVQSSGRGGGIQNNNTSSTYISNCEFSLNESGQGGGVHNNSGSININNTLFCENIPDSDAGGINDEGGILNYSICPCKCDLYEDGVIEVNDIVEIIIHWNCDDCSQEDINNDGIVNLIDLLGVIDAWEYQISSWGPCE